MASAAKKQKLEFEERNDSICGYVHNVSCVKTATRNRTKFFNAVLQISREEFRHVVVFAGEKRTQFAQAEKTKSPVKLHRIKRCVSSQGAEFDIQCGRSTEISVVRDLGFSFIDAPQTLKKTVAEVLAMAPRQQVGAVEVRVVDVAISTEMLDVKGVSVEMQKCLVEDLTGQISFQLWDKQIGMLVRGKSYLISNANTREFDNCLFLTGTVYTEIKEVAGMSGPSPHGEYVAQDVVTTVIGEISAAEIAVSQRCSKCQVWQLEFNAKNKFHRCQKCGLLQKNEKYQRVASGRICVTGDFGERDLNVTNSVLKRYLETESLLNLLVESQNVEEHLLSMGQCILNTQNDVLVGIEKVVPVDEAATLVNIVKAPEEGHTSMNVESVEEDLALERLFEVESVTPKV